MKYLLIVRAAKERTLKMKKNFGLGYNTLLDSSPCNYNVGIGTFKPRGVMIKAILNSLLSTATGQSNIAIGNLKNVGTKVTDHIKKDTKCTTK